MLLFDVSCNESLLIALFLVHFGAFTHSKEAWDATAQCPLWISEEIQRCVKSVAEYAQVLNRQQANSTVGALPASSVHQDISQALQLPKIGKQMFLELCSKINDFEKCVEVHRDRCKRHITLHLIESSYGYLCNEGFESFMGSAECLIELDQRPSIKRCHDKTLMEIESVNSLEEANVLAKLGKMCDALNFFAGCVQHPIRHNCGTNAWDVIFHVLKATTKTLLPICHFSGELPARPRIPATTISTTKPRLIIDHPTNSEKLPFDSARMTDFFKAYSRKSQSHLNSNDPEVSRPDGGLPNIEIEISQLPDDVPSEISTPLHMFNNAISFRSSNCILTTIFVLLFTFSSDLANKFVYSFSHMI